MPTRQDIPKLIGVFVLLFLLVRFLDWWGAWIFLTVYLLLFPRKILPFTRLTTQTTFFGWLGRVSLVGLGLGRLIYWMLQVLSEGDLIPENLLLRLLLGTLTIRFFWAAFIGGAISSVAFFGTAFVQACFAAPLIYGEHDPKYKRGFDPDAVFSVLSVRLGINKGTWLVQNGEAKVLNPPAGGLARFGGPGVLITQEGHAVILEQSGRISRVEGRGVRFLGPFERPSMVVNLQTRTEHIVLERVMTRDQVIISKFEFWVFHKVDPGPVHIQRGNGRYPFTDDIVLLTWSSSGMDWSGGIRGIAETSARDVIGRHTAEEMAVISGSLRDRLKTELLEQINKITAPFLGVQVIATDIGAVEFPEEVEIALLDKWVAEVERIVTMTRAEAEKDALSRKGEGEALALGRVEQVKTAIREQMIRQIIEPIRQQTGQAITSEQIAVRYIEAIEKLSKNLVADDLTALRYVEALEKIVSSEGSKTIILGEEKGFWTPTTG